MTMKRQLTITADPIDEPALVGQRSASSAMGAAICFSGIVRSKEGESTISAIEYECFEKMAERQFYLLFDSPCKAVQELLHVQLRSA